MIFLIWGVGACSAEKESGLYGYEDEYALPEPDMVPVMPDDHPGRTVDEMLGLKARAVTVKKAEYAEKETKAEQYEYQGRFGSKEKISLRKGLNVPETGMVYGKGHRKPAEEVRVLEVQKREKDPALAVSEQEILARIVAPKSEKVKIIEVVPAKNDGLPASARGEGLAPKRLTDMDYIPFDVTENKTGKEIVLPKAVSVPAAVAVEAPQNDVPAADVAQAEETIRLQPPETVPEKAPLQIVAENKTPLPSLDVMLPFVPKAVEKPLIRAEETEEIVLLKPPAPFVEREQEEDEIVLLKPPLSPAEEETEEQEREIVLLKPPFAEDGNIVLIPPAEEKIVLKRPEERKSAPSIEIFLDE